MELKKQILEYLEDGKDKGSVCYKGRNFFLSRWSDCIEVSSGGFYLCVPFNFENFDYEKEASDIEIVIEEWEDSLED